MLYEYMKAKTVAKAVNTYFNINDQGTTGLSIALKQAIREFAENESYSYVNFTDLDLIKYKWDEEEEYYNISNFIDEYKEEIEACGFDFDIRFPFHLFIYLWARLINGFNTYLKEEEDFWYNLDHQQI